MELEDACRRLIQDIISRRITDQSQVSAAKKCIARDCGLSRLPSNADILALCTDGEREKVLHVLQKKPVRTVSGVAVIAAMTSPAPCPHGKCTPCPGGPDTRFKSPQSYMGSEPAALRAIEHNYHPYEQVAARIFQLQRIGHPVDKVELIIMGGSFTARDPGYQRWFVKGCLAAMNDAGTNSSCDFEHMSLVEIQRRNETARVRNIGMTLETRPDYAREHHIDLMLELGATKVELGVQSTYDAVLKGINRGHSVAEVVKANTGLRDSCFKVGFHMMLGLPGSTREMDVEMFRELFDNPNFRPDYLKIYPTLVTEGTRLEEMWRAGEYVPLCDDEGVELIAEIKSLLPPYVRLQRVQRDIPARQILAGITKSHIRQLAARRLAEEGKRCQCIRCREAGHRELGGIRPENIAQQTMTYEACGGIEHFLSFEDKKQGVLIGFLRLRFPYKPHRWELQGAALVRELHVYGKMAPLGTKPLDTFQHQGYGERLLALAEEQAREEGYGKIAVISGIGAREYYRRHGYELEGAYMTKYL